MKRAWLLAFLLSEAALGAGDGFPVHFCAPAAVIEPVSERCEDNDIFTKSAETCLKRLRGEVNREGEAVKRFFSKGPKDKQSQNFAESQVDHANASLRLARLIRLAKKTALEVDTYFDAVYYPIDYDVPSVNGGDPRGFVMGQPCYGDTVKSLDSIMQDIVRIARELRTAKDTADSIHGRLQASDRNIDNITPTAVRGGKTGSGAPNRGRIPAGTDVRRESTITGEIKPKLDLSKPAPQK
jgi:hypothetical protein